MKKTVYTDTPKELSLLEEHLAIVAKGGQTMNIVKTVIAGEVTKPVRRWVKKPVKWAVEPRVIGGMTLTIMFPEME